MFELKARIRHLFGKHTPVSDMRNPGLWCYVCGKRLPKKSWVDEMDRDMDEHPEWFK